MDWTESHIGELKRLHAEGLSAAEIATKMECGFSRSAVLGKIKRLKLPEKSKAPATKQWVKAKKNAIPIVGQDRRGGMNGPDLAKITILQTAPVAVTIAKDVVKLIDLKPHHCRWPIGDPRHPSFGFCGCDRAPDRPYCYEHFEMSMPSPAERKTTDDRRATFGG